MQSTPVINRLDRVRVLEAFADASRPRMYKLSCSLASGDAPAHIGRLLHRMQQAQPINPTHVPADMITMNSIVRLTNLDTLESRRVALVYDDQAHHDLPRGVEPTEVQGELGSELLARRQGDTIRLVSRAGATRLRIDELEYQPELAGDFDR